jgi:hypothetical protein
MNCSLMLLLYFSMPSILYAMYTFVSNYAIICAEHTDQLQEYTVPLIIMHHARDQT